MHLNIGLMQTDAAPCDPMQRFLSQPGVYKTSRRRTRVAGAIAGLARIAEDLDTAVLLRDVLSFF